MGWREMKQKTRDNEQWGRVRAFFFSISQKHEKELFVISFSAVIISDAV